MKSIYKITNTLNNKSYIGQSNNPIRRFAEHCSTKNVNSKISKAIQETGQEHFTFEILEEHIENYNEREIYWINYYDSIVNGYNVYPGGISGPPPEIPLHADNLPVTPVQLEEISLLLQSTQLSYKEIAARFNKSKNTILNINHGLTHARDLNYPLRKIANSNKMAKLTLEENLEVHDLLKHSFLPHSAIADMFGVEKTVILKIERGETQAYFLEEEDYPLRDYKSTGKPATVTYEEVTTVINLLLTTDLSLREIGRRSGVPYNIVAKVRDGSAKRFRRKGFTYPLRPNGFTSRK